MKYTEISAIESEAGVIATLLNHPEFYYSTEDLRAGDFASSQNRTIYVVLEDMILQEITKFDAYMMCTSLNQLYSRGENLEEIELEELKELIENSELICRNSKEEYLSLVRNVKNAAFRREVMAALHTCEIICQNQSTENFDDLVTKTIDDAISKYSTVKEIPLFGDVIDDCWEDIVRGFGGGFSGIPFKRFPSLNNYCTLEKGELLCIAARKKVGKSMMLLGVALDLMEDNKRVLYIDSEISDKQFLIRMLANITGIPANDIKSGNLTEEQLQAVKDAQLWIKSKEFHHIYLPEMTQEEILNLVKRAHHKKPLDVFIVDYFKSTGETGAFENSMKLGNMVNMCKNTIAGALNIAGISACQLNENGSIAESQKIARYVSTMILLEKKEMSQYEMERGRYGSRKLRVDLNRNGPQHYDDEYIDLEFKEDICFLCEAPEQHEAQDPWGGF